MKFFLICISLTFSFISSSLASNVGIVVKKQGKAELLSNPSKKSAGKEVKYEGLYYTSKKVRPGTKIRNGDILRTGNKSKVRVVFKNGDQFNVGAGTAYKIEWKKSAFKKKESSVVNLIYGSVRGIISPKGPRNKLKIKTRNAVMGVRGTDFHFSQNGTSGNSHISVIRGKVEVTSTKSPKKIIKVEQGFSAQIINTIKLKVKPKKVIQLSQTTQPELLKIQKDSNIKSTKADAPESEKVRKELMILEKQAIKTTLEDIKTYQPKVYAELTSKKVKSIASLNMAVVKKAYKRAPAKKAKRAFDDMDLNLDEDAYKKYFKSE